MSRPRQTTLDVLEDFTRNAYIGRTRHFCAAKRAQALNEWLGGPLALINVALAAGIITTVGHEVSQLEKWAGAGLSLVAAILAGIHFLQNFSRQVAGHRSLGNRYLSIGREGDRLLASYTDGLIDNAVLSTELRVLQGLYAEVNQDAEKYPTRNRDFKCALKESDEREKWLRARSESRAAMETSR